MDSTDASTLFAWLDREIWLVTAQAGARRGGLIATFVSQASIVPDLPRVLVGLSRKHHTWELVEQSNAFALHLLGERHLDWVWRFGLESGRGQDKLHDLRVRQVSTGSPVLEDAIGWLDCRVEDRLDTGDRTVYLAEVVQAGVTAFAPPLRFQRLLQMAPPARLTELKRQLHHDSEIDAEAIRQWRTRRKSEPEA
ncbi:MAG TPA: flavin reductase family protein [Gemmataceae bacterium]|nr:flavin reductase family protein [Gemmataceae bacterium]